MLSVPLAGNQKRKLIVIMNAFITSQFGYYQLVWMFHSREMNNRINRIHERSLIIVYKNKQEADSLRFPQICLAPKNLKRLSEIT